jgi:hypothetical protein
MKGRERGIAQARDLPNRVARNFPRREIVMSSATVIHLVLLAALTVACVGQGTGLGTGRPPSNLETKTMEIKVGQPAERSRYVPGEILVKFREGTDEGTIARIQREAHLETIRVVSSPNLYLMKIVDQTSVDETVQRLQRYDEVVVAEPNYVRRIQ